MAYLIPKFRHHPFDIACTLPPTERPSIAYDIRHWFETEAGVVIQQELDAGGFTFEAAFEMAKGSFQANVYSNDLVMLMLYHQIVAHHSIDSNADAIFTPKTGYTNLFSELSMAAALRWSIGGMLTKESEFLQRANPDLVQLQWESSPDFLFTRAWFVERNRTVGQAGSTSVLGHGDDSDDSESNVVQALNRSALHIAQVGQKLEQLIKSIEVAEMADPQEEGRVAEFFRMRRHGITEKTIRETALLDIAKLEAEEAALPSLPGPTTFPEFVQQTIDNHCQPNPLIKSTDFSIYWMAPPPVSLITLYSFETHSDVDRTFLIDCFLDVYHAQMCFYSMHFFFRRMMALWSRNTGLLEPALYSREVNIVRQHLYGFISQLKNIFTVSFLALEGITLTGERCLSLLNLLFTHSGKQMQPVFEVERFLRELIEIVRDACVTVDRMRVSMLYGPEHPSYVGDAFLGSYLHRTYLIKHVSVGLESIMALTEPLRNLTLPEDGSKNLSFYNTMLERAPEEARQAHIFQPNARQEYPVESISLIGGGESLGHVRHTPTTGQLESLHPVNPDAFLLLDLLKKLWQTRPTRLIIGPEDFEYSAVPVETVG